MAKKQKEKVLEFPYSKRFCINCDCETTFRYNRIIGHSACEMCGHFGPDSKRKWKGTLYSERKL